MRKMTFLSLVARVALFSMLVGSASFAKEEPDKDKRERDEALYKTMGTPHFQILNINNLWYWSKDNGESNHSPNGDNGTYFPRGMVWAIYKDGVKWGGKAYLDAEYTQPAPYGQVIRIGGCDYGNGTLAGRIDGFGATAARVDLAGADVRMYRIRRDYNTMSTAELKLDAAESNEERVDEVTAADMQLIYDRYKLDWNEWPVEYGAPFIDRDGDGEYTPPPAFYFNPDDPKDPKNFTADSLISQGYDEPGVAGADPNSPADQVVWNVYNDLDRTRTLAMEGSEPMGLELQRTTWGYKRTDALGSSFFKRTKIINKGGVDVGGDGVTMGNFYIDSMYVGQWSDPDLGAFSDDLLGCDTSLSMGYVYNGNPIDREYARYNQVVPAAGYDFLAGPIVPSPGDVAVFDLKYRNDYKNLGMTAFSWFSAGSPITDPPSDYTGGLRWYKMLRGFAPIDGPDDYYPFPPGVEPNSFPYSGDPVTGSGLLDGEGTAWSFPMGDRRLFVVCGPFTLAPGDTQEVTVGFVAGQGSDRLSSISVMKFNDRFTQLTYDALFQVPNAPARPVVSVTELDGKVILEWGSDLTKVKNIETTVSEPGGYTFEGYNVYQLPRSTSGIKEGKRIATYDLLSDPTVILDEGFDPSSGQILSIPIQFGSNSDVKRYFEFDRDYLQDIDKIDNGQEYYLAVTAYTRTTELGYIPAALESTPEVITVIPQRPFGTVYTTAHGDTLDVEQASGASDGIVVPIVIDPGASTGDNYKITFVDTGGGSVANRWTLTNTTDNKVLLSEQENFSGDLDYSIADGIFLQVSGPPLEGKDWDYTGDRWFTGGGHGGELLYGGAFLHPMFSGGSGTAPPDYKTVEVRFVAKTGFTDLNGNGTYDIGETYEMPAEGTQKAFMYNTWDNEAYVGFFDVPFTAWDVQDPASPRQLNVIVRDRDQNQQWDLHSNVDDPLLPLGGDQRYNYVFIAGTDYDPTGALHAPPSQGGTGWMGNDAEQPGLWVLWLDQRGSAEPYGADVVLTLIPNLVITVNDVYQFKAPAPTTDLAQEKFSAERVNVFPNPYYAFNPAEFSRLSRFVTFNNLPPIATIRIFNLAGQLVAILKKDNPDTQFQRWDLLNFDGLPVASGMYIAYIEMELPSGGEMSKVLKLAIIQELELLDVY